MLLENNIGYTELNGKVAVKKRGELIRQFEENDDCKVFLSTEAGGSGLNLQVADILINFELPWNPAKKNQRIGRIDRLGQKSDKLSIFNFITINSIEQRIALGLLVKQNLFDSVLNEGDTNDFVDFTEKGRGQFLQQMKELAGNFEENTSDTEIIEDELKEYSLDDLKKERAKEYKIPFEENTEDDNFSEEIPKEEEEVQKVTTDQQKENDTQSEQQINTAVQMEEVLNNGMQFLSGLMQMATGKNVGIENQKIEVNKETGEVTMKFKLPKF
jgi:superfamily II DNA/RNA helicase